MQRVSPAKKIPAQAVGENKKSCELKIPLPPITFLMVRPLVALTVGNTLLAKCPHLKYINLRTVISLETFKQYLRIHELCRNRSFQKLPEAILSVLQCS